MRINSLRLIRRIIIVSLAVSLSAMSWWAGQSAYVRIAQPYPQSPWESQIILDAMLIKQHLPVYIDLQSINGHATHMYGPLSAQLIAGVQYIFGYSIGTGRFVSLFFAVSVSVFFGIIFGKSARLMGIVVVAVLVFYQYYRARAYFAETRPDSASFAFAALAGWLFYKSFGRSVVWWIFAIISMLVSFGFKQTGLAVAVLPGIALLFGERGDLKRYWARALVPLCIAGLIPVLLKFWSPQLYFHLFTIAEMASMHPDVWDSHALHIFTENTLFIGGVMALAAGSFAKLRFERKAVVWFLAALVIAGIVSTMAVSKAGGAVNSYLPVYALIACFNGVFINEVISRLKSIEVGANSRSTIWMGFLALLLNVTDAYSLDGGPAWYLPGPRNGGPEYRQVIASAARLRGEVLSPDDPTIAYRAKGTVCRNVVCELDAVGETSLPDYLIRDWGKAEYIIRSNGTWTSRVPPDVLKRLGFVRLIKPLFDSRDYELWHKSAPATRPAKKRRPATTFGSL